MPRTTSREKIAAIEHYGGNCHLIDDGRRSTRRAAELAARLGGHFMDQFTYAERATDWRGNNNIAKSIFAQMRERAASGPGLDRDAAPAPAAPPPRSAATCATAASDAAVRRRCRALGLLRLLADAVTAAANAVADRGHRPAARRALLRARRGRPHDAVPDAATLAAMRVLSRRLGRRVGGSTGTNFWRCAQLAAEMAAGGERSLVTLICDSGERYANTYYSDDWLTANSLDPSPFEPAIEAFWPAKDWRCSSRKAGADSRRQLAGSRLARGKCSDKNPLTIIQLTERPCPSPSR